MAYFSSSVLSFSGRNALIANIDYIDDDILFMIDRFAGGVIRRVHVELALSLFRLPVL